MKALDYDLLYSFSAKGSKICYVHLSTSPEEGSVSFHTFDKNKALLDGGYCGTSTTKPLDALAIIAEGFNSSPDYKVKLLEEDPDLEGFTGW